jgi:hypothetical protein
MTTDRPTLHAADLAYSTFGRRVTARNELAQKLADHIADENYDDENPFHLTETTRLVNAYRQARAETDEAYAAYSAAIEADMKAAGPEAI